jgi:hypothetical protein
MPITSQIGSSSQIKPGVCTSTTRPASPFTGQVIFETDTNKMLVWNTNAWVMPNSPAQDPPAMGLIASATLGSSGATISNCFTSTYSGYRVILHGITTAVAGGLYFQLQSGATPSITGYSAGGIYRLFAGSGGDTPSANAAYWVPLTASPIPCLSVTDIFNPAVATSTTMTNLASNYDAAYFLAGVHQVNTAYDGLKISAAQTITGGTVTVYGYRK